MDNITFYFDAKADIERAYRVLDSGNAYCCNVTAIKGWHKDGYLSQEQADYLYRYNRRLEKQYNA